MFDGAIVSSEKDGQPDTVALTFRTLTLAFF